jgi:large subunit ribosomal protein L21
MTNSRSLMYAIIRSGGKQFRAEPGKTIRIPSLEGEPGEKITFDDVVVGADGDRIEVGVPSVSGAKVTGEIVKHGRGDKIVVFKFKRRKNYSRKQGHRQGFTEVRINEIKLGR